MYRLYSDVTQSGFCSQFCGWHGYNGNIKYSWIGVPPSGCPCYSQVSGSPNGDIAVDSAVSVIAHELAEAVTDPVLNSWYNSYGYENADICSWNFVGRIWYNNYYYNMVAGGLRYYVQSNYNLATQSCSMN